MIITRFDVTTVHLSVLFITEEELLAELWLRQRLTFSCYFYYLVSVH